MNVGRLLEGSPTLSHMPFKNQQGASVTKTAIQNKTVAVQDEEVINTKKVETIQSQMNGFIDSSRTNLKFMYHEKLNEYYVTVVNQLTNEVVKEIPPKKMLDMFAEMTEFMGILIDEKI